MNMRSVILALLVVAISASAAAAQAPGLPITLYGGAGLGLPMSPDGFKDAYDTGYHGFVGIGFPWLPMAEIVGRIELHNFSATEVTNITGGDFRTILVGAGLRVEPMAPGAPLKPYARGQIGLAINKFEQTIINEVAGENILPEETANKFFFDIGGGVEFSGLGPATIFVEARYLVISTEGDSTALLPISLGVSLF